MAAGVTALSGENVTGAGRLSVLRSEPDWPVCPERPTGASLRRKTQRTRAPASSPHELPVAAATQSSTAALPDKSFGDRLWSALGLDEQAWGEPTSGLPVPRLVAPDRTASAYYTISAIDGRGRVADRSPLLALGWHPGLPIAISNKHGAVVVVARPDGPNRVTRDGRLRLPAPIRHLSRMNAGDRLLVAACPERDLLVAYPMYAVDTMVLAYRTPLSSWRVHDRA
jgi:hypothetical protein